MDPDEIARRTCLSAAVVAKYYTQLKHFFELRDGRLFSSRMEAEKAKSDKARNNANKRWRTDAIGNANGIANCNAQSQSQSQSQEQSQNQNLSPSENYISHSKEKQQVSQNDFDARDLRKFHDARRKLELKFANGWGGNLTDDQIFEHQCALAGVHPQQMQEVLARTKVASA
jgi:hypothetical protein